MRRAPLRPLTNAYRLLNPGLVCLVTVGDGERDNVFSVAWNMPVSKDPPLVGLLCGKGHHSYPFIERTGELCINIPGAGLAGAVLGCGSTSGDTVADKFARFGLTRAPASVVAAPLVAEALASLECRVVRVIDVEDSALLVAEVVEAVASVEHFRGSAWRFDRGLELIHHLGGSDFAVSARAITAIFE